MTHPRRNDLPTTPKGVISRRGFVQAMAGAAAALTLPASTRALGNARSGRAGATATRRLVLVPLRGGHDGLELLIPYDTGFGAFHQRRDDIKITGAANVHQVRFAVDGLNWGLHKELSRIHALFMQGNAAFVQKLGWPVENLSHFFCQDRNASAREQGPSHTSGWAARLAEEQVRAGATAKTQLTSMGVGSILDTRPEPGAYRPLALRSLDNFVVPVDDPDNPSARIVRRNDAHVDMENDVQSNRPVIAQWHDGATSAFGLVDDIQRGIRHYNGDENAYQFVDPQDGKPKTRAFGYAMRDLARMLSIGPTVPNAPAQRPVITLGLTGGYDTHNDQNARLATLWAELDAALGAFANDLIAVGEWNNTVILVYTEFGRRIPQNGNRGTDHGIGNVALVLGGGVNGGPGGINGGRYGVTPTAAELASGANLTPEVDMRWLFERTLADWLGISDPSVVIDDPSETGGNWQHGSLLGLYS